MKVGWPEQLINLYPGGAWSSSILSINVADSRGKKFTSESWLPGTDTYDASLSLPGVNGSTENYYIAQSDVGGNAPSFVSAWGANLAMDMTGNGTQLTDRMSFSSPNLGTTVSNMSIVAVYEANYKLPGGMTLPLDVGFLSLGAPTVQQWGPFIGNMIPGYLASNGYTPSNSWALHIGSAAMNIPGSLVLGGYDADRVVGDIGTYYSTDGTGGMFAQLVDITLGIDGDGRSPWPFRNKTGLLLDWQNNKNPIMVRPNPTVPYLFLPKQTCATLAQYLPVTYRGDLGLYIWNTSDQKYRDIVQSPSYLKFSFQRSEGASNLEIKVPFALLNLTLTPPLVDTPTQYLPCRPYVPDGLHTQSPSEYHLGRAFLQAAFIGMNWGPSIWWMAQAPGPGALTPSLVSIENSTKTITTSAPSSAWSSSWAGFLNDLGVEPSSSASPSSGPDSTANPSLASPNAGRGSLPVAAKIGIGVGAGVGGLLLLGTVLFCCSRKAKRSRQNEPTQPPIRPLHLSAPVSLAASTTMWKNPSELEVKAWAPESAPIYHELPVSMCGEGRPSQARKLAFPQHCI